MAKLDWVANLGGVVYDIGKDIYVFGKLKHDHVKRLDQRFQNLREQVSLLRSQIRNGDAMVQRYEIIGEFSAANYYRILLNVAHSRISRFEYLSNKYENVPRKVCNRQTNGEAELDNMQRNTQGVLAEVVRREGPKYVIGSPLFYKLAKLSEDILNLTIDVAHFRGGIPLELMTWTEPEQVVKMEDADTIENVTFLNDVLEEILGILRDDNVRRIGIWGMTREVETTVLKILNNKMEGNSMFDIVIWMTVREERSVIIKMQQDLIARLKLNVGQGNIKNSSREQKAATISRVLGTKKYLVILDGVSSNINLDEAGISREHRDGKVVFASRRRSGMIADHEIKVNHDGNMLHLA